MALNYDVDQAHACSAVRGVVVTRAHTGDDNGARQGSRGLTGGVWPPGPHSARTVDAVK